MNKQQAKNRIEVLKREINRHRYLYHVLDKTEISDAAHDSLKHELDELEREYPEFVTPDSPTQRVGGEPLKKFRKIKHKVSMLSLNDSFSEKEVGDWEERIKKISPSFREQIEKYGYFVELKIDGFAIELIYKNGALESGATRGDGLIGEDVTRNLKTIEAIPLRLSRHRAEPVAGWKIPERFIVRGEVFMTMESFNKANKEREKSGQPLYANPRNLAAGSIRQLDPKFAASRDLSFLAYDIVDGFSSETHEEEHMACRNLGFKTDGYAKRCGNLRDVFDFRKYIAGIRNKLSYQIDGVVVSVNSNRLFSELGFVGKAPRGAIAFKFPAEQGTSVVEDIKIQIGRTGTLTPVACVKPVSIGGTMVSRATLHNEDEIKKKDIRIGDTVIVERAGDVIPAVVSVLKRLRPKNAKSFTMPRKCPVCGSAVSRKKGEAAYRCFNKKCFAIEKERIIHFVSKKAFNVDGLGEKIVERLIDEGLISGAADIFKLTESDLAPLERFADKSAKNLIEAIQKSKKISLPKFLFSLGIWHIGEETAYDLAQVFDGMGMVKKPNDLLKITKNVKNEEWLSIKDIGPVSAGSIADWFSDKNNIDSLNQLSESGIIIKQISGHKSGSKNLKGKIFVLTGELISFTRDEVKEAIRSFGGNVSGSVSKKTDYVIAGENPGTKYDKAKKLGIKIINEKEFKGIIKIS